jgi:hypothetical protein
MMRLNRLLSALAAGVVAGSALLLAGATDAAAQGPAPEDNVFAQINFGAQGGSHTLKQQGTFDIYDDQATFSSAAKVGGGGLFDIGGGVRVWGSNLYAGVSYTHFSDSSDAVVAGSIPHPLRFDLPFRNVSGTAPGLDHSENQIHIDAIWKQPITTQFDVSVFLGPTIFNVKQDVVSGINVNEVGPPYTDVTLSSIATERVSKSSGGFNIGVDGTYMFTPRFGAGALIRFVTGSVDMPNGSSGTTKLSLGGVQFAVGGRVRF